MTYDPSPCYPVLGDEAALGWERPAIEIAARAPCVLALDGPAALPWERVVAEATKALSSAGAATRTLDVRRSYAPPDEIRLRTAPSEPADDPVFGRIFEGELGDLLDSIPRARAEDGEVLVAFGPGSALVGHEVLWYADLPKSSSLAAIRRGEASNLGQSPGEPGTEQRLLFVDWPVLDRHKQVFASRIDRLFDVGDVEEPRSLDGPTLRRTLEKLAGQPFRTRPTFLPGPWGGQWLRRTLGVGTDEPNLAWSYELITPESGVLLGKSAPLEVGFELLMAEQGPRILGRDAYERFGLSFPIRFDYLDTLEGGHLSIQCHPTEAYMRETFGLPYTQHETYYVMVTQPDAVIFLGLREDADLDAFREEAEEAEAPGTELDPTRYLQTQPAEQHRLYVIPAGTPHASGAGNVVLEISATPYLYTLRFYDWLRRDLAGDLRPVHIRHAFANVDSRRAGASVRGELVPEPRVVREGADWRELELARHADLFFAVHRHDFDDEALDDTADRFHVLNLVSGDEVELETEAGTTHGLSYAETIVVPAAVGGYRIRRVRGGPCKVVKAFVP